MNTYENINQADFTYPSADQNTEYQNTEYQYQTEYNYGQYHSNYPKENKVMGTIGALLGSLAGAVVYFILHQAGFIASISGLAGTYCALTLYRKFSGRQSKFGAKISIAFCLLSIVASCYFCLMYDIFQAFRTDGVSLWLLVRYGYKFLADPGLRLEFLKDLGMGLLFCILGIRNALRRNAVFGYI